jgi:hypothetical protein
MVHINDEKEYGQEVATINWPDISKQHALTEYRSHIQYHSQKQSEMEPCDTCRRTRIDRIRWPEIAGQR